MANLALPGPARPSSVDSDRDSDRPLSRLSNRSTSSLSLVSSVSSSGSENYCLCTDEMDANPSHFEETSLPEVEPEVSSPPLDADAVTDEHEQSSVVLIYSINSSPIATPVSSPCPSPPLPFAVSSSDVDCDTQTDEHDPCRDHGQATLVVWDPRLSGIIPSSSKTSILPPWWRGDECLGTFGFPAFTRLLTPSSFAGNFVDGDPRSDDMEGQPVWDPSAYETPRERARRINLSRQRRIAVLDGSADRDYGVALQAAADARARAEAIQAALDAEAAEAALIAPMYAGELSPDEGEHDDVDPVWFEETVWAPEYRLANINAQASSSSNSSSGFIPGRGFATYPDRPALQASSSTSSPSNNSSGRTVSRAPLLTLRPPPPRPVNCSPLLMVAREKAFQTAYPSYLVPLFLEEFGKPPYPKYLLDLLSDDFLRFLTNPELLSDPNRPSEPLLVSTTVPNLPVPDLPETSVVIEWEEQQPIELIRSLAELVPAPLVLPPNAVNHSNPTMSAPSAAACSAPVVNERRLARTEGRSEFNSARRTLPEPLPIVRFRLAPNRPPERLEDVYVEPIQQTDLITDNHTPLYNANGYSVHHLTATFARLSFMLTPEPYFRHHRFAHLTHRSETEGIPMRFPLNTIFQLGDLLMLWTCYEAERNHLLVTSFVTHDAASFRLCVAISIQYENGSLTLLSARRRTMQTDCLLKRL